MKIKTFIFTIILSLLTCTIFAQAPQKYRTVDGVPYRWNSKQKQYFVDMRRVNTMFSYGDFIDKRSIYVGTPATRSEPARTTIWAHMYPSIFRNPK